MVGVEAARRLGVPSIYEMRGLWHLSRASKEPRYLDTEHFALAQKMEVETALGADHVLAITGALKKWLIDHGVPEWKISTTPNAVDLERFKTVPYDPAFAEKTGCSGRVVIGYIGSFVQYEGLDFLLRAVALLPSAVRQKILLLWVGDGPVLEELLQLGAELGVADTIKSLGRQPFGDIPSFYGLVDFCVFPRKGQAVCEIVSPLKPFEAMAMQKAVIVSDVTPLREIVTHGKTGLIHVKDDVADLKRQIEIFVENETVRASCGQEARLWVEQTRNWQTITGEVASVYGRMTGLNAEALGQSVVF
jgi:glycosyltransferase involved in cell wall biosynthesis